MRLEPEYGAARSSRNQPTGFRSRVCVHSICLQALSADKDLVGARHPGSSRCVACTLWHAPAASVGAALKRAWNRVNVHLTYSLFIRIERLFRAQAGDERVDRRATWLRPRMLGVSSPPGARDCCSKHLERFQRPRQCAGVGHVIFTLVCTRLLPFLPL